MRTAISGIVLALLLPLAAFAQDMDLKTSIRAALASDPRTQGMTEAQIDAMVQALSSGVEEQGLTPADIAWRPVPQAAPALACYGFPAFFCAVSEAFGFTGPEYIIPLWLGISALLLIFLIGAALEYRHFRHLHPRVAPPAPPLA